MTEAEAKDIAEKAKLRVATHISEEKKNSKTSEPTQSRLKALAKQPDEIERENLDLKKRKGEIKKLPKKERTIPEAELKRDEAILKLKKAEKKLKEAEAKNNAKAIEKAKKAVEKAKKEVEKAKKDLAAKKKKEKLNMKDAAKKINKNTQDLDKTGMKKKEDQKKGKEDDKTKGKEKTDEKKKSPEQKKQEEMQKKYQHKELPGGMIIKQEGPSWKLYSPDMKRSKDVTHEIESLIKTNKEIDATNENIDKNNKLRAGKPGNTDLGKEGGSPTRDTAKTAAMEDNAAMGISTGQMKIADPQKGMTDAPVNVPDVKITDLNGKELSPADAKALAKLSVDMALSSRDIEKLKEKDRDQKKEQDRLRIAPQKEGGR